VAPAHSLGADLVAEGVEDEATLQALEWTNRCIPAASMSDLALHPDLR
jgi:diguanylate cyclase